MCFFGSIGSGFCKALAKRRTAVQNCFKAGRQRKFCEVAVFYGVIQRMQRTAFLSCQHILKVSKNWISFCQLFELFFLRESGSASNKSRH